MGQREHFVVLDGLRGVAALLVVLFHICEVLAGGKQEGNLLPHAALAVDFFFALSGFVIAHAYDHRWPTMSLGQFALRRIVRLHPMVVIATLFGALVYAIEPWGATSHALGLGRWALTLGLALLVLPYPTLPDRYTDTHSLDGPTWTLFQEYIGNLAYALVLRRLPTWGLATLLLPAGALLIGSAMHFGTMSAGFGFDTVWMAPVRLAFPFIAGMTLYRLRAHLPRWRLGLWPLGLVLVAVFAMPVIDAQFPAGPGRAMNGLAEALVVIVVFPAMIVLGADSPAEASGAAVARWLGRLSYPLYMIHYPLIYAFIDFAIGQKPSDATAIAGAIGLGFAMLGTGIAAMIWWDEPVRRWAARHLARLGDVPGNPA